MNNSFIKGILFILVIMYIISPVDACPGPIDDLIFLALYAAGNKSLDSME